MSAVLTEKLVFNFPFTLKEDCSLGDDSILKCNPYWISRNFSLEKRKPIQSKIKTIFDFSATLAGLLAISPIILAVILAIKLESKGPILFKQKRIGRYGKEFYMYKFRSMHVDAEKMLEKLQEQNQTNNKMFKMFNDPRVTKVGKFIRKYSIDELPQLINVLKGEMSLVGFRPPLQREVDLYDDWHYLRFAAKPGLTGMWQVSGRSTIKEFDQVVKLEYDYVNQWNILLDFKLLLKTIPVVLFGKDAA
ncbi:MAG: sugar transferase [bacterium]